MNFYEQQISTTIQLLDENRKQRIEICPFEYIETSYKKGNDLPPVTDEWNDIIVRLYECYNCAVNAKVILGFDARKAYLCDMLENIESECEVLDNKISIPIKNYEILTLRLVR